MKIKTILVDDEVKSLDILENKLKRFCPDLDIVGKIQNPEIAITAILEKKPDLIFLDITMPNMSGFDLLSKFEKPDFEIIFATGFNDYAIEAIRQCAIGYLVKPIDNLELVNSVKNAVNHISLKNSNQKNKNLLENRTIDPLLRKIAIPSQIGYEFIKIKDIIHCEGIDGYTKLHFENRKEILSSFSIGYFQKLVGDTYFFQTHKSHLVNLTHVEKYLNEGYVHLTNGISAPVSKTRRIEFLKKIK